MLGKISAISVSDKKGVRKVNVDKATLIEKHGIKDDAHAGAWHRQISLLAKESIDKMVEKGLNVSAGDFAENITTTGIDLLSLPVGTFLHAGSCKLVISQIGKVCHHRCAIYYQAGDCVMPREGIFAEVVEGGEIAVGDGIQAFEKAGLSACVLTLSDRAYSGVYPDKTAPLVIKTLQEKIDFSYIRSEVMADNLFKVTAMLLDLCDNQKLDLVVINGSTGVSPDDIAPEAVKGVIDRELPGFSEIMRMKSYELTPTAIVSRAVCGIRRETLIISLPGSPKGAVENLNFVINAIEHTILKLKGDKSECAKI